MKYASLGMIFSGVVLLCTALYKQGQGVIDQSLFTACCITGVMVVVTGWGLASSKGDAE